MSDVDALKNGRASEYPVSASSRRRCRTRQALEDAFVGRRQCWCLVVDSRVSRGWSRPSRRRDTLVVPGPSFHRRSWADRGSERGRRTSSDRRGPAHHRSSRSPVRTARPERGTVIIAAPRRRPAHAARGNGGRPPALARLRCIRIGGPHPGRTHSLRPLVKPTAWWPWNCLDHVGPGRRGCPVTGCVRGSGAERPLLLGECNTRLSGTLGRWEPTSGRPQGSDVVEVVETTPGMHAQIVCDRDAWWRLKEEPAARGLAKVVDGLLEVSMVGSFSRVGYGIRRRVEGWNDPHASTGKTMIVTGASSGIGQAVAASSLPWVRKYGSSDETRTIASGDQGSRSDRRVRTHPYG